MKARHCDGPFRIAAVLTVSVFLGFLPERAQGGIRWELSQSSTEGNLIQVEFVNERWIATTVEPRFRAEVVVGAIDSKGEQWQKTFARGDVGAIHLAVGKGQGLLGLKMFARSPLVVSTVDGLEMTLLEVPFANDLSSFGGFFWGRERFIVHEIVDFGASSVLWFSEDGLGWERLDGVISGSEVLRAMTTLNGLEIFVGGKSSDFLAGSPLVLTITEDSIVSRIPLPIEEGEMFDVVNGDGRLFAVGGSFSQEQAGENGIPIGFMSTDGLTWEEVELPFATALSGVAWADGYFVVVGSGLLAVSTDLQNWETVPIGFNFSLWDVATDGSRFIAVGQGGVVLRGELDTAPALSASLKGQRLQLSWADSDDEVRLETASEAVGPYLPASSENQTREAGRLSIELPVDQPHSFFRLMRPVN